MSDLINDEIEEIDSTSTAIVHDFIAEVEAMPASPAAAAGAVPSASPRGDACAPSTRGDAVVSFEAMPASLAAAAGAVPSASPRGDARAPSTRGDAVVSFVPSPRPSRMVSVWSPYKSKATKKVAPSDAPTTAPAKAAPAPAVNLFKRSFMFGTSVQGGEEISHHMLASLDEAFRFFDLDGNGTISKDELRAVLESFGEKPDEDDLQKMMKECDTNDSDTIDFQEFCTLMVTRMNDIDDPVVLEEAFKMFDKDGNGQISRAELGLAFQNILQTTEEDLPLTEMEDMLRELNKNGDGNINFAEFKQYMMED